MNAVGFNVKITKRERMMKMIGMKLLLAAKIIVAYSIFHITVSKVLFNPFDLSPVFSQSPKHRLQSYTHHLFG